MCASRTPGTGRAPVRVFLLSGHALIRRGLAELLLTEGFAVVGEADSIAGALPRAAELAPEVALV